MKTILLILSVMLCQLDSVMQRAMADKLFAGAVVCYVENDSVSLLKAYGNQAITPQLEPMTTQSVFDLASCSKATGAGSAAMLLIGEGRLSASDPVKKYLPEWDNDAQIHHLMEHTSGLPSYLYVKRLDSLYRANTKGKHISRHDYLIDTICHTPRLNAPGEKYRYSCLNFITLQNVVERIVGKDINTYMRARLYKPLDMEVFGWLPKKKWMPRIVSTEYIYSGTIEAERKGRVDSTACLRGIVHDPLARVMNEGISGNAGIFATAQDLAKWCVWFMSLTPEQREAGCNCGLWTDDDGSVGHTGYTGTSIRLWPEEHKAIILLTNRVHPEDKGNLREVRQAVRTILHP